MDPMIPPISKITGHISNNPFVAFFRYLKGLPKGVRGGDQPGCVMHAMAIYDINMMAKRRPGKIPAINNFPMEFPVKEPYKIIIMDGGIRIPSVPPAQIDPRVMPRAYPYFWSSGYDTPPIATVVAVLDPEQAANILQATMLACNIPPGKGLNIFLTPLNSDELHPLLIKTFPISTKSGNETRV